MCVCVCVCVCVVCIDTLSHYILLSTYYVPVIPKYIRASQLAQQVKNPPARQEAQVQSRGLKDPLEEERATHSSILLREIPWTEEPDGLQSSGLQSRTGVSGWAATATLGSRSGGGGGD